MKKLSILAALLLPLSMNALADTNKNTQGKQIYDKACSTCHAPNVAKGLEAPAAFSSSDWAPRLAAAKTAAEQDSRYADAMSYLVQQVKIGRGLMHHGGLCREAAETSNHCSDDALQAAILYMSTPAE